MALPSMISALRWALALLFFAGALVTGAAQDAPAQLPYPERHVRYAEDVATLLRSIHRRYRIFDDIARDRQLRDRLMNALDAAERLLSEIKKRNH